MATRKRQEQPNLDLRRKAERRLGRGSAPPTREKTAGAARPTGDAERLWHELEVHEVELELQNEELKNTRAEVETALARYTEVFDFAPIGYATLTATGDIDSINHAAARLLGQPRQSLLRRKFALFLTSASQEAFATLIEAAHASDSHEEAEVELAPYLGASRQLLRLWATALAGAEPRLLVALEDITERKAKEELLVKTEEALRESNRRKDEFLAMLSHELRNPLAPIRNCLYLLGQVEPGGERARNAHAIIEHQVAHLARLVDDLLDLTRITKGKMHLRRAPLRLSDLVKRTVEDHRDGFHAKGLSLEARIEPGDHWVFADAVRMVQVLSNLLTNAQKFTTRGGKVTVSLRRQEPLVVLEVSDTGIGITAEVARTLFEPFAQAPQTMERGAGGLGLGLAMVKRLVELHGGRVALASEPGRGTTVTLALPLVAAPTAETDAERALESPPRRVLIIEDNRDAADSLREALAMSGHEVEVAYDGLSGVEAAHRFRPGVVICDIGLPGMDGYEVATRLRGDEELRDVYLIALTGYARPEDLERAVAAGFQRHLAKPPTVEKILEVLGSAPSNDAPARPASPPP